MNWTEKFASTQEKFVTIGRDEELAFIMLSLLRYEKPNLILHGEPGVGKTHLIQALAYAIAKEICPEKLQGYQVIEINTNDLLSGDGYRGVTEQKFSNLINGAIRKGKVILFMDEFHTVENLGKLSNNSTPGLGNTLKPYLTRPDFRLIGATTTRELGQIKDTALLRRFGLLHVAEPTKEAVLSIIDSCFLKYGQGLDITSGCVELVYKLSELRTGFNPDKSKDLVDIACSYAKLNNLDTVDEDLIHFISEINQPSEFVSTQSLY
jgi:ATP-dependent Clp protease ATP-binding subunit ClpA